MIKKSDRLMIAPLPRGAVVRSCEKGERVHPDARAIAETRCRRCRRYIDRLPFVSVVGKVHGKSYYHLECVEI